MQRNIYKTNCKKCNKPVHLKPGQQFRDVHQCKATTPIPCRNCKEIVHLRPGQQFRDVHFCEQLTPIPCRNCKQIVYLKRGQKFVDHHQCFRLIECRDCDEEVKLLPGQKFYQVHVCETRDKVHQLGVPELEEDEEEEIKISCRVCKGEPVKIPDNKTDYDFCSMKCAKKEYKDIQKEDFYYWHIRAYAEEILEHIEGDYKKYY